MTFGAGNGAVDKRDARALTGMHIDQPGCDQIAQQRAVQRHALVAHPHLDVGGFVREQQEEGFADEHGGKSFYGRYITRPSLSGNR